jgi:Glutaredoxin-like domain (DUF836)
VSDGDARVVVLVSAGCHLCDDACAVVTEVCTAAEVGWEARDLSRLDEPTRQQWREFVPVILVDGEVHDLFRVDPGRLRAALGLTAA